MTIGIPMSIGTLRLTGTGVPDEIVIGGAQRLAIHELPGGGRTIDVMGAQDETLIWRGVLTGSDAITRAEAIDALRRSGTPQTIGFGSYSIDVVIERFSYAYAMGGTFVRYQIRCQPTGVVAATAANATEAALATGLALGAAVLGDVEGGQPASAVFSSLVNAGIARSYSAGDVATLGALAPALTSATRTANAQINALSDTNGVSLPASPTDVAAALRSSGTLAGAQIASGMAGQAGLLLQQSLGL